MGKKTYKERLLEKIKVVGDCWIWTGAKGGSPPYQCGVMQYEGRLQVAARLSLKLIAGVEVPKGMCALHAPHDVCGSTLCINPAHLRVGTYKENTRDQIRDGTALIGDRNPVRQNPDIVRGTNNGMSKLDEGKVREILGSDERLVVLARRYGVSSCSINDIRKRRTWRWVEV